MGLLFYCFFSFLSILHAGLVSDFEDISPTLEAAWDRFKKNEVDVGVQTLGRILEKDVAHFTRTFDFRMKGGIFHEREGGYLLARVGAEQMLGFLPESVREKYEIYYGNRAEQQFNKARQNQDLALMREVFKKYRYTKAGDHAAMYLGTYFLDRAQFELASVYFLNCLQKTKNLSNVSLLKIAYSLEYAGYLAEADQVRNRLKKQMASKPLILNNKNKTYEEIETFLNGIRLKKDPPPTIFPSDRLLWKFDQTEPNGNWNSPQYLGKALFSLIFQRERDRPYAVPFFPLLWKDKIFLRTPLGIIATDLNGNVQWSNRSRGSMEKYILSTQNTSGATADLDATNYGRLSTDGKRLYSVEDDFFRNNYQYGRDDRSRLIAFDLETGEKLWTSVGLQQGLEDKEPYHFMAPPLAPYGIPFTILERKGEFLFAALHPDNGSILWSLHLPITTSEEGVFRVQAIPFTYYNGKIFIYHNQVTACIDTLNQELLWLLDNRFDAKSPQETQELSDHLNTIRQTSGAYRWTDGFHPDGSGNLIFTQLHSPWVYSIDSETGRIKWKKEKEGALYLDAASSNRILIVRRKEILALSPARGEQLWKIETPTCAGRGVHLKGEYYLPSLGGKIYKIKLETGKIIEKIELPGVKMELSLGNLALFQDRLVVQSWQGVYAFSK